MNNNEKAGSLVTASLFAKGALTLMPMSIDPPPAENEIECARCGAYFYQELTRCPRCGVNVYEPEDESDGERERTSPQPNPRPANGILAWVDRLFHQVTKKPYPADELFGAAIDQAALFNNLLRKVGGDRAVAERLVDFERKSLPNANRIIWLQNAIQRWEQDNESRSV